MSSTVSPRVAVLWRGDRGLRNTATPRNSRFRLVFEELGKLGIEAEPSIYDEEVHDEVGAQLRTFDAVLVWVNPIQDGRDRQRLNELLREVARDGPWVSAHPDVIDTLGVKDVLFRTRDFSWGTDTQLFTSFRDFQQRFRSHIHDRGPRVIKRSRGNDGQGVWKVECLTGPGPLRVRACEAHGGYSPAEMPLEQFVESCQDYFENGGAIVDQPFQPRLHEGMTRCYVSEDRVAGFAHQHPSGLMDPADMHPDASLGKLMFGPEERRFARLKAKMEAEWIPQLMTCLGLTTREMPVIWDADFLYGPRDGSGADTYVLCEINVSSVFAIPDQAATILATSVARRFGLSS